MSALRLTRTLPSAARASRTFTTTTSRYAGEPVSENPPSARAAGKENHVSSDSQSSASTKEHLTGDDHPAKQPDPQQDSESTTGFNEVKGGVTGGKEGLGHRSDRNSDGSEK